MISLFSKKISIWHGIYWLILTVVINVFLFTVCPGKINDAAMDNVSFASTIVSIVLAVISIIYSLQSGFSSSSQLDSIKDIEGNIKNELTKFQSLRKTISDAVSPIESIVGDIQKTTGDLQKAQDDINRNLGDLNKTVSLSVIDKKDSSKKRNITLTHTMVVSLYAAVKSHETGMDIPFHVFANFIGSKSHYAEGMLEALSALDDGIKIEQGSSSTRKIVTKFNEEMFGTMKELKEKAEANSNKRIGVDFIAAIDKYYSDKMNQQSKDSVG